MRSTRHWACSCQAVCLQLPELLLSGQRTCCMWTTIHVSGPSCSLSLSRSLYDWSAGIVDTKHWLDVCWSELLGAACIAEMDDNCLLRCNSHTNLPSWGLATR